MSYIDKVSSYLQLVDELEMINHQLMDLIIKEGFQEKDEWINHLENTNNLILKFRNNSSIDALEEITINKIDSYNLGTVVLGLYESGHELDTIAEICSKQVTIQIEEGDIENWLNNIKSLPATAKVKAINGSVFDTRNRLEEIYKLMQELLQAINTQDESIFKGARITREQVILQWMTEMRNLLKEAKSLLEADSMRDNVRVFMQEVINALKKETPLAYANVMKTLEEKKLLQGITSL